jgi:hypothetical protein
MDNNKILKCSLLSCCSLLNSKIGDANHKGFVYIQTTNTITGKERLIGIAYKTSVKDLGTLLNFCPFCGERIDWFNSAQTSENLEEKKERLQEGYGKCTDCDWCGTEGCNVARDSSTCLLNKKIKTIPPVQNVC